MKKIQNKVIKSSIPIQTFDFEVQEDYGLEDYGLEDYGP